MATMWRSFACMLVLLATAYGASSQGLNPSLHRAPSNTLAESDYSLFEAFALVGSSKEASHSRCGDMACPLKKAVCCKDGSHCCPLGSQCMKAKHGGPQLCGTGVRIPTAPGFSDEPDSKCKCARLCPTATCSYCPCKRKVQNVVVMLPGEAGIPTKVSRDAPYVPKGHRLPNMPDVE